MTFWIIAGALTAGVGALLVLAILGGRKGVRQTSAAESDIRVYRDQLAEVERDLARGLLSEDEAKQVKIEVSRRLLEADRKAAEGGQADTSTPGGITTAGILGTLAVVGAGTIALYLQIGQPGYPDLPLAQRLAAAEEARATRPTQAVAEAEIAGRIPPAINADPEYLALLERLRMAIAERPDDLQGQMLLARNEAAIGNYTAARSAQERVIAIKGPGATAADYADLADLLILAAGGYVSPEAEAALLEALRRSPGNGTALYYSGLLYAQIGRPDRSFAVWERLLSQSAGDEPWVAPIRAQILDIAQLAGVRYELPPEAPTPLRGPSQEEIEAARDMAPEDRAAMIDGMVAGLSDRLATEGGPVEDWARLITALGVLGRLDEARAIAEEAETAFGGLPEAAAMIAEARARAGVAE